MRSLLVIVCGTTIALLAACGGNNIAAESAARNAQFRSEQLGQLDTLACPAGVDVAVWATLKSSLRAMLSDPASPRSSSTAPTTLRSRAVMEGSPGSIDGWHYASEGDYDQNGEVNISDLTALGINFGKTSGGGPFPFLSIEAVVDGDSNGDINIADLTPIGANFGNRVTAYAVYASGIESDVPTDTGASIIGEITTVAFNTATGNPTTGRIFFPYPPPDPGLQYNWVRPVDGTDGTEGIRSTVLGAELFLSLDPTPPGSGTAPDPYQVLNGAVHTISAVMDFSGNVTLDPRTSYAVNPATAASVASDQLTVGTDNVAFTLTASFAEFSGDASPVTGMLHLHAGPTNALPIADLIPDVTSGNAPLLVNFDASASFDPDGAIATYEWDWEDDGTVDQITAGPLNFNSYGTDGQFTARVTAVDDLGGRGSATAVIDVLPNQPPLAVLSATPGSGVRPLDVILDASASSDPDGSIASIDFDLDGDGTYETPRGLDPLFEQYYVAVGSFNVGVQVTDNGGATDTATQPINVTGSWHFVDVDTGVNTLFAPSLDVANGNPAMAWMDTTGSQVFYARANDVDGVGWGSPVQPSPISIASNAPALMVANGNPAIYFNSFGNGGTFVRSSDSNGAFWGFPTGTNASALAFDAMVIAGMPGVAFMSSVDSKLYYQPADNADGSAWTTLPVGVDTGVTLGGGISLALIDNTPAISYKNQTDGTMSYSRALLPGGTAWDLPVPLDNAGVSNFTSLALVDGEPAVASNAQGTLRFLKSSDLDGVNWPTATTVDASSVTGWPSLMQVNGLATIAYPANNKLNLVIALDPDISGWGAPEEVDDASQDCEPDLLEINGHAAIAYTADGETTVRYAVFF